MRIRFSTDKKKDVNRASVKSKSFLIDLKKS